MKKIIAILLSAVCLFSCMGIPVSALDNVIDNIGSNVGMEPDSPIGYGIIYKMDTLEGVSIMYQPKPTITFTSPGTYTVTNDTPLSVDYEFVCWKHEDTGKNYYAGDKLYIDGQEVLIAVWQPKTDGHIRPTRVLLTAIETLRRTIGAFFGIYKVIDDFKADLAAPKPTYEYFTLTADEVINVNTDETYEADPRTYNLVLKTDKVFDTAVQTIQVNFYGDAYDVHTGTNYPANFTVSAETTEYEGKQYQFIKISLVDGVPSPVTGTRLTITIPEGYLKYEVGKNENGTSKYMANKEYTLNFLVTSYV